MLEFIVSFMKYSFMEFNTMSHFLNFNFRRAKYMNVCMYVCTVLYCMYVCECIYSTKCQWILVCGTEHRCGAGSRNVLQPGFVSTIHVCLCMYVCWYVCMYVRMYVCMYVVTNLLDFGAELFEGHVQFLPHLPLTLLFIQLNTYIHTYIGTNAYIHTTQIHTYIHTYTIHMHFHLKDFILIGKKKHKDVQFFTEVHTHTYIQSHTYLHTYIQSSHTYIHTFIHTRFIHTCVIVI